MDYLVSPSEETDWRMDPAEFESALRARWELVRYHPNPEHDMFAFDFDLAVDSGLVDGGFARDGKILGLGDDVYLVAHVAVWFRELVPAGQSLLFYDQMYDSHVELTPGMSATELAEAYLAGLSSEPPR